jgi:uncharacterized membrane protein
MKFKGLQKNISENLIKGTFVLLPFLLSFYFLFWFANLFDRIFSGILDRLGVFRDLPFGIGIVIGLIVIYALGRTSEILIARHINKVLERFIKTVPILGSVFGSIRDLTDYFKAGETTPKGKAVILTLEHPNLKIAGFLTRSDLYTLPTHDNLNDLVAVYIPLAYMVGGGFTVFAHKSQVQDLDMPFDIAMKANLSAWMLIGKTEPTKGRRGDET